MARIRTVKPEFWTSGQVMRVSRDARLLFIGLLNFADDEGRGDADPFAVKARVFPGDSDIDSERILRLLAELSSRALLVVYEHDGRPLYEVPKFTTHQKIDRPTVSKLPSSSSGEIITFSPNTEHLLADSSSNPRRVLALEGNGMESKGKEETDTSSKRCALTEQARQVFEFWKEHMDHPRATSKGKRQRAIEARLRDGYDVDELCDAIRGCALSPHHMGKNDQNKVYDDIELICRDASKVDMHIHTFETYKNFASKRADGIGVSVERGEP